MSYEFVPHQISEQYLLDLGVDFENVVNDGGGILRQQLTVLSSAPFFKSIIKKNAYLTIARLDKSKNLKNIDVNKNVKNTLIGTVSGALMDYLDQEAPQKIKRETMIKWLPSSAHEADPFHALQYGKTMTLEAAISKGLGVRYNCQCGMQIVSEPKGENLQTLKNLIEDKNIKSTKQLTKQLELKK